ncbi:MAG: hypothetical protein LQ341_003833 [Variospora aurantia]|nr:MAG: hypothetical protein LQ341_003833 [Variospora aurantia]
MTSTDQDTINQLRKELAQKTRACERLELDRKRLEIDLEEARDVAVEGPAPRTAFIQSAIDEGFVKLETSLKAYNTLRKSLSTVTQISDQCKRITKQRDDAYNEIRSLKVRLPKALQHTDAYDYLKVQHSDLESRHSEAQDTIRQLRENFRQLQEGMRQPPDVLGSKPPLVFGSPWRGDATLVKPTDRAFFKSGPPQLQGFGIQQSVWQPKDMEPQHRPSKRKSPEQISGTAKRPNLEEQGDNKGVRTQSGILPAQPPHATFAASQVSQTLTPDNMVVQPASDNVTKAVGLKPSTAFAWQGVIDNPGRLPSTFERRGENAGPDQAKVPDTTTTPAQPSSNLSRLSIPALESRDAAPKSTTLATSEQEEQRSHTV